MKKLIVSLIFITGCSVNASKISQKYANEFVNKMTYAKDERAGLCYGIVASRQSGSPDSTGIGITLVPYSTVERFIK